MFKRIIYLLCVVIYCCCEVDANNGNHHVLRQVHVVTYHGASYPLSDVHPDERTELTPMGEKQMYDLGIWLSQRYGHFLKDKESSVVHMESSIHRRSLTSAATLALGLYNNTSSSRDQLLSSIPRINIPIYTPHYEKVNDVTYRASDTCTTYQTKVQSLFSTSNSGVNQVINGIMNDPNVKAILEKLAKVTAFAKYIDTTTSTIHIQYIHDIVETISVVKSECGTESSNAESHACQKLPQVQSVLSDKEWVTLQSTAYTIETIKYSSDMAGTLVGGFLLHNIIERMMGAYEENANTKHMYIYSAQDTLLWGIATAVGESDWFVNAGIVNMLLPYGSSLIFELYDESTEAKKEPIGNNFNVDLYFKPGNSNTAILLSTVCRGTNKNDCPLVSLSSYVSMNVTKSHWCKECNNDSAEICIREIIKHNNGKLSSDMASSSCTGSSNLSTGGSIALGIFWGIMVSIVLYIFCIKCCCRNKHQTPPVTRTIETAECDNEFT